MASEVIKEFLVSLGFQVDETSASRFSAGVSAMTVKAAVLGNVVVQATDQVLGLIRGIAQMSDQLFFMSKRVGASVENIQAFSYALSQMGSSGEAAQNSLETLAKFIASSPGAEGWIQSLGVGTRGANGQLRDTVDILTDLGTQFAKMPRYIAIARAEFLGLDYKTLIALAEGVGKFRAQYDALYRTFNLNGQQVAEAGNKFMTGWRLFIAFLEVAGAKVFLRTIELFQSLVEWFENLSPVTRQTIELIGGLLIAWRLLNAGLLTTPLGIIFTLANAILLLWDDYKTWKEGGQSLIDWAKWEPNIQKAIKWIGELDAKVGLLRATLEGLAIYMATRWGLAILATLGPVGLALGAILLAYQVIDDIRKGQIPGMGQTEGQGDDNKGLGRDPKAGPFGGLPGGPTPTDENGFAKQAIAFFVSRGWSAAAAAGLVGNLQGESSLNPHPDSDNAGQRGLAQWDAERQKNIFNHFGKKVEDMNYGEQLAAIDWEARQRGDFDRFQSAAATGGARAASDVGVDSFELPKERTLNKFRRGNYAEQDLKAYNAPTVTQNNTFNVNGAQSPATTAAAVKQQLDRANADLVRNMKNPVQ